MEGMDIQLTRGGESTVTIFTSVRFRSSVSVYMILERRQSFETTLTDAAFMRSLFGVRFHMTRQQISEDGNRDRICHFNFEDLSYARKSVVITSSGLYNYSNYTCGLELMKIAKISSDWTVTFSQV